MRSWHFKRYAVAALEASAWPECFVAAGAGLQRHGNLLNQRKRPAGPPPMKGKEGQIG